MNKKLLELYSDYLLSLFGKMTATQLSSLLKAIYKKRWKVEIIHKTLKSNSVMEKSLSHTVLAQSNHLFMSVYPAFRPEILANKLNLNHFELRAKLYLSALRSSIQELRSMKKA